MIRAFLLFLMFAFSGCQHMSPLSQTIAATSPQVAIMGRVAENPDGSATFGYPGVTFLVTVDGGHLTMTARSTGGKSWVEVRVDDVPVRKLEVPAEMTTLDLYRALATGEHKVAVTHFSETWHGLVTLQTFTLEGGNFLPPPTLPERKMLVLGDSVTCGEALDRVAGTTKNTAWWNARESYGMQLAEALDAQVQLVCWGGRGLVRSWDNRTDQPMLADFYQLAAGEGDGAVKWNQSKYRPDLILSAIGTNDFGVGIPERDRYVAAYVQFLKTLRREHPQAQIVLTEGSILGGQEKRALVAYIKEAIAQVGDGQIHYLPSQQYSGDSLDGHPTKAQHAAMAQDLLPGLRRIMNW